MHLLLLLAKKALVRWCGGGAECSCAKGTRQLGARLGAPPPPACPQDSSKWGGAIELSILSRHLGKEIAAFDIQTKRWVPMKATLFAVGCMDWQERGTLEGASLWRVVES